MIQAVEEKHMQDLVEKVSQLCFKASHLLFMHSASIVIDHWARCSADFSLLPILT